MDRAEHRVEDQWRGDAYFRFGRHCNVRLGDAAKHGIDGTYSYGRYIVSMRNDATIECVVVFDGGAIVGVFRNDGSVN